MRTHRVIAGLALLTAVLASCSASGDDASSEDASSTGVAGDESTEPSMVAEGGASGDATGGAGADVDRVDLDAVPVAAIDRKIIYTGTTTAEVDDVPAAVRAARDAASVEGGYVFAQDLGAGDGRVVLKVPVDRFDAVFDVIVGIGHIADQQIEAEDVTERFVDLESRQATLAISIDRIRGFLAEATNVDEISRLEAELTRREAEHDVIAGQLRVLRDRTSFGTITAHFHLADDAIRTDEPDEGGGPPGFGQGLSTGWDAVTALAGALATAIGFVLPFAPALAALAAVAWWIRRRRGAPEVNSAA